MGKRRGSSVKPALRDAQKEGAGVSAVPYPAEACVLVAATQHQVLPQSDPHMPTMKRRGLASPTEIASQALHVAPAIAPAESGTHRVRVVNQCPPRSEPTGPCVENDTAHDTPHDVESIVN